MKAFPTTKPLDSWGDPNAGMDLRDYFAAKALQALAAKAVSENQTPEITAEAAYMFADSMMEARKNDS
jgi:hypothetical protein